MSITAEALAELRRRLLEAEDTLRAIREGEVDALVIGRLDRPEVYAIGGDTEAFRAFIEVMDAGAAAVDAGGRILYANRLFVELLGASANSVQGARLSDLMPCDPGGQATFLNPAGPVRRAIEVPQEGGARQLIVASSPLQLGTITGHAITLTDVTERLRAERAEQNERMAQSIIASVNEAVLVCDANGRVTHSNAPARSILGLEPTGRRLTDLLRLQPEAGSGFSSCAEIVGAVLAGRSVRGIEVSAPDAPLSQDFLISAAPLEGPGLPGSGCVISIFDIANRKVLERQQRLLMGELDHRVKNTLALVLSICRQTFRHSADYVSFEKAFTRRIRALSDTHNLLARSSWAGLSVEDVIEAEAEPHRGEGRGRLATTGCDIRISAEGAIALGLIVHELTTNAVKHGALSGDTGRVDVSARRDAESVVIEWRETGGPLVQPPVRRGYGETVITRSLQFAPGSHTSLRYDPEGVICTIVVPESLILPMT
ncbi:sensor histidine kinase [Falsirhodobacter algicola]|uniref:histidine kinase n=1 Tax=Falsirhodobacter algicola TaxID=2692330 RepID=A0A8J8MVL0_9RHOB|nr:sensor histidine kinase [Falsirhodobacter algicola]QUS37221.1 PAS domain S-box protein [Falsirhodobacter algicola]